MSRPLTSLKRRPPNFMAGCRWLELSIDHLIFRYCENLIEATNAFFDDRDDRAEPDVDLPPWHDGPFPEELIRLAWAKDRAIRRVEGAIEALVAVGFSAPELAHRIIVEAYEAIEEIEDVRGVCGPYLAESMEQANFDREHPEERSRPQRGFRLGRPDASFWKWQNRMERLRRKVIGAGKVVGTKLMPAASEGTQAPVGSRPGPAAERPLGVAAINNDFMPAVWFKTTYGIQPSRLRVANSRKKLRVQGKGRGTRYSVEDVRRLWPEDTVAADGSDLATKAPAPQCATTVTSRHARANLIVNPADRLH